MVWTKKRRRSHLWAPPTTDQLTSRRCDRLSFYTHPKIALQLTNEFSVYGTGISLFSDDHLWQTQPVATLLHALKVQTLAPFNLSLRLTFRVFWIEIDA